LPKSEKHLEAYEIMQIMQVYWLKKTYKWKYY